MSVSESEFNFIAEIVREESAIALGPDKAYLVESRLLPLLPEFGLESIPSLLNAIKNGQPNAKQRLVEAFTTNETFFFRDHDAFDALRNDIIPALIQKRAERKELRIWSAASSTGQEAYSIAMMMRENFPQTKDWKITIVGTDISPEVLAKARAGAYNQIEVNRGLPAMMLIKYFDKDGPTWRIKDDLRALTQFKEMNLVRPWSIVGPLDLVLIRNVLIYFEKDIKAQILGNVRKVLAADGYVMLGGAETTLNIDDNYERLTFKKGSCFVKKA